MSPFLRARLSLQVEAQSPMRYLWRSRGPNGDVFAPNSNLWAPERIWYFGWPQFQICEMQGLGDKYIPCYDMHNWWECHLHNCQHGLGEQKKTRTLQIGCKIWCIWYTKELLRTSRLAAPRNSTTWTNLTDVTWTYLDYLHGSCSEPGDFVSLHCPLNADTKHLINKEHWCQSLEAVNVGTWGPKRTILSWVLEDTLKLMKPTAYLINTGSGVSVGSKVWLSQQVDVLLPHHHATDEVLVSTDTLLYTYTYIYCISTNWERERERRHSRDSMPISNLAVFSNTRMRAWAEILSFYPIMYCMAIGNPAFYGFCRQLRQWCGDTAISLTWKKAVAPWLRTCGGMAHNKLPFFLLRSSQEPELIEALQNKTIAGAWVVVLLQPRNAAFILGHWFLIFPCN